MARGITFEWEQDFHGNNLLVIRKSRGKLTIREIGDLLLYGGGGLRNGRYAIIINASESAYGGSGWDDGTEPKGDVVELVQLEPFEKCPMCAAMLPDPDYCPECGFPLKQEKGVN